MTRNILLKNISPRTVLLLVILSVTVFIITGCSGTSSSSTSNKQYTGYDSIEMTFANQAPPDQVNLEADCAKYSSCDNEIPIIIQLKNKGASDTAVEIFLHGYDQNIISVAGDDQWRPRKGFVNFNYIEGKGYTFSMGGQGVYLGFRGGGTSANSGFNYNNIKFGIGSFTNDGSPVGVSINAANPKRIGFNAGKILLNAAFNYCGSAKNCGFQSVVFLEGDTRETPGGGLEVLDFPAYAWGIPESLETFRQPLMVTACYSYETRATAMVCIDPKPNNNNKKACKPGPVSLSGGQGAPVAITRIDQQAGTRKTSFTISVKHNKKGSYDTIYDLWSMYKCNPYAPEITKATDLNVVYVRWAALSGIPLTCMSPAETTGYYKIRLDDSGTGQIVCSTNALHYTSDAAYEAPLELQLDYGYSKSIQKTINIRQI
ncbi:MAG: hypothetical protein WC916_01560 [Candidatus Woesearchaeota archaeon]